MNIAFVSNFHKTFLFSNISRNLSKSGYKIFWFCFSNKYYNYLIESGVLKESILLLNRNIKFDFDPIGEYKINELLFSDRALAFDRAFGFNYLVSIQSIIYNFIKANNIEFIFGEMTYAHEILMSRICLDKIELNCSYLHPQSIRIPNGRFSFMNTEFQNTFHPYCIDLNKEDINNCKLPIKAISPQRVKEVASEVKKELSFKGKLFRIKRMFTQENIDKDSPCIITNNLKRYKIAFNEEKNRYLYRKWFFVDLNFLIGKKFFFYTLHMQPEASIDVVGRYYENQFQTIQNIWRILPNDYLLIIKEHTNAIGNRSYKFYKDCTDLRNVFFLKEEVSSHEIIMDSEAIFTNSGTVALEAALLGKVAFVFSKIFFDRLKGVYNLSLECLKFCPNYFDLLKSKMKEDQDKLSIAEYSEYIISLSFPGVIDPPISSSLFYDKNNLENIVNSFDKFLKYAHKIKYQ